jgi:TldD protein
VNDDERTVPDLDVPALRRAIQARAPEGCLHASLYMERSTRLGLRYAGGRTTDVSLNQSCGSSMRWITADDVRYRSSDAYGADSVLRLIAGGDESGRVLVPDETDMDHDLITGMSALADEISAAARSTDDAVSEVLIESLHHGQHVSTVSLERSGTDKRAVRYITVTVSVREGGRLASSSRSYGTSCISETIDPLALGRNAVDSALRSLSAIPAPIGHMPVILSDGAGMTLIHDACCHSLEGDEVLRGSVFSGRLGERLGADFITIDDDPLLPGAVGSYALDDEGTPAASTKMVTEGRLSAFLTDAVSGLQLGAPLSGNCRRDGYMSMPLPRMSNTRVQAGSTALDDVIADTDFGLFVDKVGSGEVVESTGDFVMRVASARMIRGGRLCEPVGETALAGNGADILASIDAVCSDATATVSKCNKYGQSLPVGLVGPSMRIRSLQVGGIR